MSSEDHGQKHATGVVSWIQTHYAYPNIVTAREGQKILSPMDTCLVRGAVGGVMGGALGVGFGLIMHMSGPASGLGAMPFAGQTTMHVPPPQQLGRRWRPQPPMRVPRARLSPRLRFLQPPLLPCLLPVALLLLLLLPASRPRPLRSTRSVPSRARCP